MDKEKKRPSKYTVLFVPNNAGNVKQFKLSADFLIAIIILLFLSIIGAVFYIIHSFGRISEANREIEKLTGQLMDVTSSNIILEAEKERLEKELMDASISLEMREYVEQQTDNVAEMSKIPSILPISGGYSKLPPFDEGKGTVTFTVGDDTRIVASGDGVVEKVVSDTQYGYRVEVRHTDEYVSIYRYNGQPEVKEGDKVMRNSSYIFICNGGSNQFVYEVQFEGKAIDPYKLFKIDG